MKVARTTRHNTHPARTSPSCSPKIVIEDETMIVCVCGAGAFGCSPAMAGDG